MGYEQHQTLGLKKPKSVIYQVIFRLLLFVCLTLVGCAEAKQELFNCDKWNVGGKVSYLVELTEIKAVGDSIVEGSRSNYKVELVVTELGKKNILTWHIKVPIRKSDSLLAKLERGSIDTVDYIEERKIVYQVNQLGQYQEILNWPEVDSFVRSFWEGQFSAFEQDSKSKKEQFNKISEAVLSRPALEANLTKDIMALHLIPLAIIH